MRTIDIVTSANTGVYSPMPGPMGTITVTSTDTNPWRIRDERETWAKITAIAEDIAVAEAFERYLAGQRRLVHRLMLVLLARANDDEVPT